MKGKNHVRVGACSLAAGTALGIVPWDQPRTAALAAGVFLFGKVAPDLDHAGSSITKSWGPISILYSWALVRPFARLVYAATRTAHDRERRPVHRGFTHTVPGAVLAGLLLVGVAASSPVALAVVLGMMVGGAARVYDRDWLLPVGLVAGGLAWYSVELLVADPWPLAFALALGCVFHSLDDCTTKFGTPLLFPLRDRETGQRWRRRGLPEWLAYETGSAAETAVMGACFVATVAFLWWVLVHPLILQMMGGVG